MNDTCEYCHHPYDRHKEDSACECFEPGCDCTLGKAMNAISERLKREAAK